MTRSSPNKGAGPVLIVAGIILIVGIISLRFVSPKIPERMMISSFDPINYVFIIAGVGVVTNLGYTSSCILEIKEEIESDLNDLVLDRWHPSKFHTRLFLLFLMYIFNKVFISFPVFPRISYMLEGKTFYHLYR